MLALIGRTREVNGSPEVVRRDEDFWDEPELSGPEEELELLQGLWITVAGRRQAELLVAGGHYSIRFDDDSIYMGRFDCDPDAQPKAMDIHVGEGPPAHKGKTALAIYELAGDTLRWCVTAPGRKDRLTAFPAEDDVHSLALVFRRAKALG
jgi:uncharacterized protein (TIGR03067 family)